MNVVEIKSYYSNERLEQKLSHTIKKKKKKKVVTMQQEHHIGHTFLFLMFLLMYCVTVGNSVDNPCIGIIIRYRGNDRGGNQIIKLKK